MNLLNRIRAPLLVSQHGHPRGLVGRMLGEKMQRIKHILFALVTAGVAGQFLRSIKNVDGKERLSR